ncbi:MAG TPA: tRNA epoxyqueuosine(34) reductase QueG [Alphaproteobacteria bacterium]|nr:tRNA epoxyqueuosine(34) reductase QueG [Alphaproteobacteria bacterium]
MARAEFRASNLLRRSASAAPAIPSPRDEIARLAHAHGFDAFGVAAPHAGAAAAPALDEFLSAGFHGGMDWMAAKADRRRDPRALWPDVRSIVVVGLNYGPGRDPLEVVRRRDRGAVSVYANGRDYHDVFKKRLKRLAREIAHLWNVEVKVFVDTAPVMEKPLAQAAGLGWQGKHTNLVSTQLGSWLFLGEIFTTLELAPDTPAPDSCGTCHACLDICPTQAMPAPYRLDARRCISYLTIEHKGPIAREFRAAIGNRIYGCDDCLAVCPWNKFARASAEAAFRPGTGAPALSDLAALDDAGFRKLFAGSAIKRTGRDRFVRNVMIALGNSGREEAVRAVEPRLRDGSALVRGMAVWALSRLRDRDSFVTLRARIMPDESDAAVLDEWREGGAQD